jgi:hypothetical protein
MLSLEFAPRRTSRDASDGVLFSWETAMAPEPLVKGTIAFFDGQNLFHAARKAFGYTYPYHEPVGR